MDRNSDNPFEEFFERLERMMSDMMEGQANVDVNVSGGPFGATAGTHVDVQQEDEMVRVMAVLPGVTKDDIQITCDGTVLSVAAENDSRQYHEQVELPVRVDETSATATYNNGVLEIAFDRDAETADIDVE